MISSKAGIVGIAAGLILVLAISVGWAMNMYKAVAVCDYEPIGRCELVRILGVFVVPLGGIVGYLDLGE